MAVTGRSGLGVPRLIRLLPPLTRHFTGELLKGLHPL